WQMTSRATASPNEALAWVRQGEPFDAVILDMQMPEMDGLSLAIEIQKERDARALPLIMLTSLGGREARREADWASVEFAAFLTKPIKPSQLFNVFVGIFSEQPRRILPPPTTAKPLFDAHMGQRHPLHILLAEDHPTNQKLALRLLGRLGYRADVAANGHEVLAALERQHYDVVLMDMQMPEMDGLETTRWIRRQEAESGEARLWIVAMTANAMQGDRELCLAAGMNDYVSKPIRVEALVEALGKARPHEREGEAALQQAQDAEPGSSGAGETSPPYAPPIGLSLGTKPAPGPDAILDTAILDQLLEMTGGDPQFLAEMIDSYLETTPPLLEKLKQSLAAGDAAAFRMAAHTLKSGSTDFGALTLAGLCARLEEMGKAGVLEDAAPLVTQAEAAYEQVKVALAAIREP
ncbi:MAG: response regulator, partial [Chloroflexota bacterium]